MTKLNGIRIAFAGIAFVALTLIATPALAQQPWPTKSIRLVIANSPGAAPDLIARVLSEQLAKSTGQPWLVENRPGGDELIAADAVVHASPDGYTLLLVSQSFVAVNPNTFKSMPVDPARDFMAIAVVIDTTPIAIGVSTSLPANNLAELIALAKKQPGKIAYGVTVPILSMVGQWLSFRAGMEMTEIMYKSSAQQLSDAVTGTVPVIISTTLSLGPMAKAGKLRIIGVTSPNRVEGFPDVPSVMETFPDLNPGGGLVILGPLGLRPEVVSRINRETDAAVKSSEFTRRVAEFGWANVNGARTPAETAEYIRVQRERWAKVVKDLRIQPK